MKTPVSAELRAVEREVDTFYRNNALLSLPRSQAMWYLLAECEEWFFRRHASGEQLDLAYVDTVMNLVRWPLRWLWKHCGSKLEECRPCFTDDYYEHAHELACLGRSYQWFETAFTYASRGRLELALDGPRIRPRWGDQDGIRFDAYDRLRDTAEKSNESKMSATFDRIAEIVCPTVRVKDDTFEYALNPRIFKQVYELSEPFHRERFKLPGEWRFPKAGLVQYTSVLKAIWVFSLIHSYARLATPSRGLHPSGYHQSLVLMDRDELTTRLRRYLGLNPDIISGIIADLTFGGEGTTNPDIALQPLVPMGARHLGWAPSFILSSSLERNLLALLNRLPKSKEIYSRLAEQLEGRMRESFRRALIPLGFRLWWGNVPGWGTASEVDLAIVDDRGRCVLILELKSFISPADRREVADKAVSIEKGVEQVIRRQEAFCKDRSALDAVLKVDKSFPVHFGVASESAVCCGMAQVGDAAVVRSTHLIDRITQDGELSSVCEWLWQRRFLPVPDRDFEKVEYPVTVGGWTLEWYQVKPLAENYC